MRSVHRFGLCLGVLAATFLGLRAEPAARAAEAMGFGAAVLVGDGEIFVGEAANQFRPGAVYVYRKSGAGWQAAATLTMPDAKVGDRFGSTIALDGENCWEFYPQDGLPFLTALYDALSSGEGISAVLHAAFREIGAAREAEKAVAA